VRSSDKGNRTALPLPVHCSEYCIFISIKLNQVAEPHNEAYIIKIMTAYSVK